MSPSFSFWFIALIKTDRGPISPARFGRPQLGHRLNSFAFTPVPRRRKICALLLTSCFMARGGVAEREGLAAPLRCCYKSHATPKKMGRTSKVAKTHKSPFSFSSRSKKHFLRFSNRKKKETHVDRGTPSSIQMDFTLSKPETLLQPPSHVKLCVGRGKNIP